ncbi:IS630 family transposase [Puniceicoccus vermicola]|uniref:IS630 family transposase n=1 Tax=Puniceicoccus vermicola TaxID=388746 RepID=UPI00339495CE
MENRDARTLSQDAQQEMRRQAIRALKKGRTQTQVAKDFGVAQPTVNRWWKRFEVGGWAAIGKGKRGRQDGSGRKMTADQEKEIQKLITDKTPDQLKLRFALWTREAVRELIKNRFKIEYGLQSMSVVLARWGFTPQRPLKKAYEQRPAEVKQWMGEVYPEVKKKAKAEKAEIWWGDETAIKPECHFRRSFSPKGVTPVVRQSAKRFHSSLISAINNQGKMQWMPLKEAINSETFLKFLRQLVKFRKRKIILIVDNLRVHHSKPVKEWLEQNTHRIELVFLPAYSPELNPDEYLNNYLKQTVTAEERLTDKVELDATVKVKMFLLGIRKHLVKSFFRHPAVQYAGLSPI